MHWKSCLTNLKIPVNIQPRYIIAITVAVAIVMVTSAAIELRQSKAELYHVMEEGALSLAEAIALSSANNLLSMEHIENLLAERLLNNAHFIARLDSLSLLTPSDLRTLAETNHIFRINIFDRDGKRVLSSHAQRDAHEGLPPRYRPEDVLGPILSGDSTQLVIGLKEARFEEGQRYAVAVRRSRPPGGAIVLNLDAATLLEFRREVGIGTLIRDLGDNSGVEYVVLQDREGILAASGAIQEMTTIESDSLLARVYETDSVVTRVVPFQDREVLEVVKTFSLEGMPVGLFRLGLAMDEIRATENRMQRRVLVMSAVLLVFGALVVLAIVALQNLKLAEQRYRSIQTFTGNILEQMQDAVVTVDAHNRITLFNKQAQILFGLGEQDVLGHHLKEIAQRGFPCLDRVLSAEMPYSELIVECAGGAQREVAVTISETLLLNGSLESRTAVIRDMTEARRMARMVQRKDKLTAMGELASGVAHEIRNPLNAIAMIAQRFEGEFTPRNDVAEYKALTGVLKAETQRVNAIVHQFLRFARPADLNLQVVPMDEFVDHVAILFHAQAAGKGVKFRVSNDCRFDMAMDRDQMTQAVLNILQNSLDATPTGGRIELLCARNADTVMVSVKDNGNGISPEVLGRIFDLYYTSKSDGTGMGLSISQQIIARHDGHIEVSSEEGKGTRFDIVIPFSIVAPRGSTAAT